MPDESWAPLVAFAVALLTLWGLLRHRLSAFALDLPNQRSLHQGPVPRTGGLGVYAGILAGLAWVLPVLPPVIWPALALFLAVSMLEDFLGVPAVIRLGIHLLAAGVFATTLLLQEYGVLVVLAAALAFAWMANLYNFMDGSDGLAGGMTAIGFSTYGIAAWLSGNTEFALLNLSIGAAASAFLMFNFHPARIFLGDTGAVPLGFLAAAFGLLGVLRGDWPAWFPLLVFSPFILDASVTLARRLARLERVWEPHCDHYYQRLVQLGWGHRGTAWLGYALMLASAGAALIGTRQSPAVQGLIVVGSLVSYGFLLFVAERAWRRFLRRNA